jgi:hypothetical protein
VCRPRSCRHSSSCRRRKARWFSRTDGFNQPRASRAPARQPHASAVPSSGSPRLRAQAARRGSARRRATASAPAASPPDSSGSAPASAVTPGTSRDSRGSATGTGPGVEPRCTPPRTRGAQRATAWSPQMAGSAPRVATVTYPRSRRKPLQRLHLPAATATLLRRRGCVTHTSFSREKLPLVSAPRAVHDLPPAPPLPAHRSFDVRHEHSIARAVRLVLER